jgi:hypothetical protein
MSEGQTIPNFPVPDFSDADAAFGADAKHYLPKAAIPADFYGMRHHYCKVAQKLFFEGGKLSDHGLRFKDGIDHQKAMRALRALLCSFAPKHEIKIGTVGVALVNWCEEVSPLINGDQ